MNRRQVLMGSLALLLPGTVGAADATQVRYNFNRGSNSGGGFGARSRTRSSSRSRYSGKKIVRYSTTEAPGSIIINTRKRALYFVLEDGKAIRYGVGVGRQGFSWTGAAHIRHKAEWPAWHPPEAMRIREYKKYGRKLPVRMEGGPKNPLGARALYLFQGNRDTLYRIHGTNNPSSIGHAMSSGCIRLLNEEVVDLYNRVRLGAKVIVT